MEAARSWQTQVEAEREGGWRSARDRCLCCRAGSHLKVAVKGSIYLRQRESVRVPGARWIKMDVTNSTLSPSGSQTRSLQALLLGAFAMVAVVAVVAGCGSPVYSRGALEGDGGLDGVGDQGDSRGNATGGKVGTGGLAGTGGVIGIGGDPGTGGAGPGGAPASGGSGAGGRPGGAPGSGGRGGSGGIASTGGRGTGGAATGGAATGGAATGGRGTGGAATGGAATGGAATGGAATGGAATGGAATGGQATGGAATGGAGTGGALLDDALYNFETSSQSWGMAAGGGLFTSVASSTTEQFAGAASLAGTVSATAGLTYILEVAPPTPAIPPAAVVTFHVFVPATAVLGSLQPYVLETGTFRFTGTRVTSPQIVRDGWTTAKVTVPSNAAAILRLGVQFESTGSWAGTVYVDAIDW